MGIGKRREALKPGRDKKNTEVNDGQSEAERYDSRKFKAEMGCSSESQWLGWRGQRCAIIWEDGHILCAAICALAVGREGPAYGTGEAESWSNDHPAPPSVILIQQDSRHHKRDDIVRTPTSTKYLHIAPCCFHFLTIYLMFHHWDSGLGRFDGGQHGRKEQLPPQGGPLLIKYDIKNNLTLQR